MLISWDRGGPDGGSEVGAWLAPSGNDEEASVAGAARKDEKGLRAEIIETAQSQLCRAIYAMVRVLGYYSV